MVGSRRWEGHLGVVGLRSRGDEVGFLGAIR